MSKIWVVNDYMTTIPGTRTLWHDLCEWLDADWMGGYDYSGLAAYTEAQACCGNLPSLIVRNATWFQPIVLPVPTISLLQDIMPEGSVQRAQQVSVCRASRLTVFNSAYTRFRYPELDGLPHRIIPLSVDFDLFKPVKAAPISDIVWVGAPTWVKGWDILAEVIHALPYSFVLVLKEPVVKSMPDNVRVFDRVPHTDLVKVLNGCSTGFCTSREETQHLAGLEMGACGLPLVVPKVGAYYARHDIPGILCDGTARNYVAALDYVMRSNYDSQNVRAYWEKAGFTREACRAAWKEAVEWTLSN